VKHIHIGHHFYGSGNIGDDFMLAGFLYEIRKFKVRISCCSPYNLNSLTCRFPEVEWLPYTAESRRTAIQYCDAWLGLGGSPFQCSVSDWFTKHLIEEMQNCSTLQKPVFFLGIGGQDDYVYNTPETKALVQQSKKLWVRDKLTFNRLNLISSNSSKVVLAEDLAHIFFENNPLKEPTSGNISVALNFDYQDWSQRDATLDAIECLNPREHIWLSQESRHLPGAEKWLYSNLSLKHQSLWKILDINEKVSKLVDIGKYWPTSEWVLTSRFHTTLASAWAGSKIVVLSTNLKLSGVAEACGIQALAPDSLPSTFIKALKIAEPISINTLKSKSEIAKRSIEEFSTDLFLKRI